MAVVAAIYTAFALVQPLGDLFREHLPKCKLINIIDDSLIEEVISNGGLTLSTKRRLLAYFMAASQTDADVILNTCSSVGEIADLAQAFISKPLFRMDRPMAKMAVLKANKIGVLATLPTTLGPTTRLLFDEASKIHKRIHTEQGLAEGAFQELLAGNLQKHDELLEKIAIEMAPKVEIFVLAQGSMARIAKRLQECTGREVLSSLLPCILALKNYLEGGDFTA
nr:aspartate/glutamate racemase family protein [Candidatus Calescibacterium sp.]